MNGNAGVRNIRIGGKPLSLSTTYKYRPSWRPHSSAVGASTAPFCHTLSRTLPLSLPSSLHSPSSSLLTLILSLHAAPPAAQGRNVNAVHRVAHIRTG